MTLLRSIVTSECRQERLLPAGLFFGFAADFTDGRLDIAVPIMCAGGGIGAFPIPGSQVFFFADANGFF